LTRRHRVAVMGERLRHRWAETRDSLDPFSPPPSALHPRSRPRPTSLGKLTRITICFISCFSTSCFPQRLPHDATSTLPAFLVAHRVGVLLRFEWSLFERRNRSSRAN